MEELKIEMALEPNALGLEKITHLSIEVKHDSGGWSCLSGENHRRGVICRVTPVCVETHNYNGHEFKSYGTIYDGKTEHQGFYVFLAECGRKSPKKLKAAFDAIKPHADEIKNMFVAGRYTEIAQNLNKWYE